MSKWKAVRPLKLPDYSQSDDKHDTTATDLIKRQNQQQNKHQYAAQNAGAGVRTSHWTVHVRFVLAWAQTDHSFRVVYGTLCLIQVAHSHSITSLCATRLLMSIPSNLTNAQTKRTQQKLLSPT